MSAAAIDFLKNHISMQNVAPLDLARLCASAEIKEFASGDVIFSEKSSPDRVYLILEGAASLFDEQKKEASQKSKGDFIGEEGAFISNRYTFSAVAKQTTHVLALPKNSVDRLVSKYPHLYSYFFASFHHAHLKLSPN